MKTYWLAMILDRVVLSESRNDWWWSARLHNFVCVVMCVCHFICIFIRVATTPHSRRQEQEYPPERSWWHGWLTLFLCSSFDQEQFNHSTLQWIPDKLGLSNCRPSTTIIIILSSPRGEKKKNECFILFYFMNVVFRSGGACSSHHIELLNVSSYIRISLRRRIINGKQGKWDKQHLYSGGSCSPAQVQLKDITGVWAARWSWHHQSRIFPENWQQSFVRLIWST